MSEAAARQRKSELARIHIGKMQLFDDDGDCRAMLESVAGVRSAADLDGARRRVVLEHLKACRAECRPAQESGLRRNATASPGLGERAALLAGVDRSAMTGRRDYAMLQPAATYGLRSGLAGLTVAGREDRGHPSVASGTGERASVNRGLAADVSGAPRKPKDRAPVSIPESAVACRAASAACWPLPCALSPARPRDSRNRLRSPGQFPWGPHRSTAAQVAQEVEVSPCGNVHDCRTLKTIRQERVSCVHACTHCPERRHR